MLRDDRIRIQHMLDAARESVNSALGSTRADLDQNRVWALGLVKCVEIIGEAAAHVAKVTGDRYPQIPWAPIVAMRNRLVHAYFDIDHDQVWKAATEDLPPLVAQLKDILKAESLD